MGLWKEKAQIEIRDIELDSHLCKAEGMIDES